MQQAPPGLLQRAAQADNPYGLNGTSEPAATNSGGMCRGGGMYCWTLNWNEFVPPSPSRGLPIYSSDGGGAGNGTYNIQLAQGEVVGLILVNPSAMVYRDTVPVPQALGMGMSMGGSGSGDGMGGMAKGGASPSANSAGASTSSSSGSVGMGAMAGGGSGTSGSDSGTSGSDSGNTPGYAVVRFRAANPGVWVFHCHIDLHAASGMLLFSRCRRQLATPAGTSLPTWSAGPPRRPAPLPAPPWMDHQPARHRWLTWCCLLGRPPLLPRPLPCIKHPHPALHPPALHRLLFSLQLWLLLCAACCWQPHSSAAFRHTLAKTHYSYF